MSDPVKQVTNAARGVSWNILAMASVLPVMFGILIWMLYRLDPVGLCKLVQDKPGTPPGNSCFQIIQQVVGIQGHTIYLLVGAIVLFLLILVVAAVKAVVGLVGPGGLSLNLNTKDTPPNA